MAKEPQELKWIETLLPEGGYHRKGMFGGFTYYIDGRMILAIFESPGGDNSYRGQKYPFEIWNGCMFPVEHDLQAQALRQFPYLVSHPILPKWLYLPLHTEGFDELVSDVLEQAIKPHGVWGSFPKSKKAPVTKKRPELDKISTKIDTRRPRMFGDEPVATKLAKAEKISDLKNLGPVTEKEFHKAGIKTAQKFIQLGWQASLRKLIKVNPKNRHTMFAYALIGALTNKEWNRLSDDEKLAARSFVKSLPVPPKKKSKK